MMGPMGYAPDKCKWRGCDLPAEIEHPILKLKFCMDHVGEVYQKAAFGKNIPVDLYLKIEKPMTHGILTGIEA